MGNICKFVERETAATLVTTRFFLETKAPQEGDETVADTDLVFLVTEGTGFFAVGSEPYILVRGCLLFIFAGQTFRITHRGDLQYLSIAFRGSRTAQLYATFGITPTSCVFREQEGLIPIWQESLVRAEEATVDLLSESMLLYAFSTLRRENRERAGTLRLITEYMEDHFTEPDLTLVKMAEELGYNTKYLSHRIKQELGMGFAAYLKELRIRNAVLLIRQGVTSVKNIAVLCGFVDPLYFSKVFRAVMGVSPKEYVAEHTA